jgi:hypothetical protein
VYCLLRSVLFYSIVTRGGASVSVLVDIWLDVYICSVIDELVIEILLAVGDTDCLDATLVYQPLDSSSSRYSWNRVSIGWHDRSFHRVVLQLKLGSVISVILVLLKLSCTAAQFQQLRIMRVERIVST